MYDIKYDKEFAKTFNEETIKKDRNKHIINNIPLAVKIAKKYCGYNNGFYDNDDIIQLSCMGIITAIDRFNFNKGVKFSTYMALWSENYIKRFKYNSTTIRIPEYLMKDFVRVKSLINEGYSFDESISILKLDGEKFKDLIDLTQLSSIDFKIESKDHGEISISETIDSGINIEEEYCENEMKRIKKEKLVDALNRLSDDEKFLIQEIYFNEKKLSEISNMIGVKRTTLSMRKKAALKKLKGMLQGYDEFAI